MKKNWILVLFTAAAVTAGCLSGESKTSDIATDMCGCFNMLKDSLPADGIIVFEKAAASDKPQETFTAEMQKLKPEVALKVNAALMATAKPGSAINGCIKALDKKYKTSETNQQAMAQKMIDALKDKKGCDIMMALLRMNLKK
ncbi:MAG: hypothetical protein RIR31_2054 [Bacteroidota bacterium]|jgi:hypothetical protein